MGAWENRHRLKSVLERSLEEERDRPRPEPEPRVKPPPSPFPELGARARHCLDGADIDTVEKLLSLTWEDTHKIKNLGKKTWAEIEQWQRRMRDGLSI